MNSSRRFVFISGATSGIGKAIADHLVKDDTAVIINSSEENPKGVFPDGK